jgi:hypothetical protein
MDTLRAGLCSATSMEWCLFTLQLVESSLLDFMLCSFNHSCALLSIEIRRFSPQSYIQLVSLIFLYWSKLNLCCTCGCYIQAGSSASSLVLLALSGYLPQASPSRRILRSTMGLAFLTLMLTLSTFVHVVPGLFFTFVLSNGLLQAGFGSYLQISVIAVASLFGPTAVQAVMSGQAAVAVVVSGVQVLSAATSLWGMHDEEIASYRSDGTAEERSAFLFFALSTLFLLFTAGAHQWLIRTQAYQRVIRPARMQNAMSLDEGNLDETEALVSNSTRSSVFDGNIRMLRVAKANIKYEFAVAYVFVVTLVRRTSFNSRPIRSNWTFDRPFSLQSPLLYNLPIQEHTHSSSAQSISSSSMSGIS